MKGERLHELTALLINHQNIGADQLARRLGVSVRTIYRDIESLSLAGVPILSLSGKGGGYCVDPRFQLGREVLKPGEIGSILAGLKGLSTILDDRAIEASIEKFQALAPRKRPRFAEALYVELAPTARAREAFGPLRRALDEGRSLNLSYSGGNGQDSDRRVDPLAVVFHWNSWYLFAWCHLRGDYRLFKLARVRRAAVAAQAAGVHDLDLDTRPWRCHWDEPASIDLVLRFGPPLRRRIEEEFEPDQIQVAPEGFVTVHTWLPEGDWLFSWLMGFGGAVEVVSPPHIRAALRDRALALAEANGADGQIH